MRGNIPRCCSKAISEFKNCIFDCSTCTRTVFEECINEIKGLKCDVLYIRWMSVTDAFNVKSVRYNAEDVLRDEFFNIAHDVKYTKHNRLGQYLQTKKLTMTEVCKKLIEQNPGTKILVGLYGEAIQVWEEDDKIEYRMISKIASEPWRKVK